MQAVSFLLLALVLSACAAAPSCPGANGTKVYEARNIGQEWIDYVWVELPPATVVVSGPSTAPGGTPAPLRETEGKTTGRLFVASADPVGAIVPTMIDLACAPGPVEYAPAPVEFTFDAGRYKASYAWGSCAKCSECYMKWTFSLDVDGQVQGNTLVTDLTLNETFHSGPMKIVTVRMKDVTGACTEPRLTCAPDGTCGEIRYERRK